MLSVQLLAESDELIERNVLDLLVGATNVDGYGVLLCLVITEYEDVRILVVLEALDLRLHVLIAVVRLDTDTGVHKRLLDLLRIGVVLLTDRNEGYLIRIQPEREVALEVLDDDTDETLEGTIDCTVDNDRHLL